MRSPTAESVFNAWFSLVVAARWRHGHSLCHRIEETRPSVCLCWVDRSVAQRLLLLLACCCLRSHQVVRESIGLYEWLKPQMRFYFFCSDAARIIENSFANSFFTPSFAFSPHSTKSLIHVCCAVCVCVFISFAYLCGFIVDFVSFLFIITAHTAANNILYSIIRWMGQRFWEFQVFRSGLANCLKSRVSLWRREVLRCDWRQHSISESIQIYAGKFHLAAQR